MCVASGLSMHGIPMPALLFSGCLYIAFLIAGLFGVVLVLVDVFSWKRMFMLGDSWVGRKIRQSDLYLTRSGGFDEV